MKKSITLLLLCLTVLGGCITKSSSDGTLKTFLNLNFEESTAGSDIPIRWFLGEIGYKIQRFQDTETTHFMIKIMSNNPNNGDFGMVLNYIPINIVKGKTVLFKGKVKTENVTNGYAGLWSGVNQSYGPLDFNNWNKRGIANTTDWQLTSYEIFVDETANEFNFGLIFNGEGTAWFKDLEIYIDGEKYQDVKANELDRQETEWLSKSIYPLKSFNPREMSNEDLLVLNDLIGKSTVVALGEVTHGASEIFQMKCRIIKYLIENKNFNVFSLEANMPEAYKINNYIIKQKGSPEDYLKGLYFWTWNTQEVLDFVEWMKEFNSLSERKIQFTGFDMQLFMGAISVLQESFVNNKEESDLVNLLNSILENNMQKIMQSENPYTDEKNVAEIYELTHKLESRIKDSQTFTSQKEWLIQNLRIIEQSVSCLDDDSKRDKYMADNFMWIKQQNPSSKFILWGHNAHISKAEPWMGSQLAKKLGSDYINIGFAFYEGDYNAIGEKGLTSYPSQSAYLGTYEYYFNKVADTPMFILDLRKVRQNNSDNCKWLKANLRFRTTGGMKITEEFNEVNVVDDYDIIIFINKVTPTKLLSK